MTELLGEIRTNQPVTVEYEPLTRATPRTSHTTAPDQANMAARRRRPGAGRGAAATQHREGGKGGMVGVKGNAKSQREVWA